MNLAIALSRVPAHLIPNGRYHASERVSVADLPEYLFEEGARMRAAGAEWAEVTEWVQSQGISIAGSTVRNAWLAYMKRQCAA